MVNYKTKAWIKAREYVLARDRYICQYYKRYGKTVPATMVHHIYPAQDYPELFLNANNLISLSNEAHEKMHNRNSDELSDEGRKLQARYKNKIFKNNRKE